MVRKVLFVAEKPAIAKAISQHLSGGQITTVSTSFRALEELTFLRSAIQAINM